jgi:NADPH2:quinone reductase
MATIRAVVVDPEVRGHLTVKEVDAPEPLPNETLVRVAAVSLNRGEVRGAQRRTAGARIGWDLAGTVERAAANGAGPTAGQRVVGVMPTGGWAEQVAVPAPALAALPDEVSFAQAATLPVAGLTALHALQKGGILLGQNVLITGASGGVGHLAVQLARQAGARVIGLVRQPAHIEAVKAAGAHEVVADETGAAAAAWGPYNLILDGVSGPVLGAALRMLTPGGTCVVYGASADSQVTFDAGAFFLTGHVQLYGLYLFAEPGLQANVSLATLAGLIADGRLHPQIELEAPWTEVGDVAQQLLDRSYAGKAVLHID